MAVPLKYADAKYVFLTDFDGTITTEDSNDHMVDTLGMGYTERRKLNEKIIDGSLNFREGFRQMLESVDRPFPELKEIVRKNIKLDPGFKEFYEWAKSVGIPVIVVSSGMTPIIRAIFSNLIGEEEANQIEIISNDVKYHDEKGDKWEIVYRHPETSFGHDKSMSIAPYRQLAQRPTLFFAGDGISDMSAARHADVLFVKNKQDNDLATYCRNEKIPFVLFDSFSNVKNTVDKIMKGEIKKEEVSKIHV